MRGLLRLNVLTLILVSLSLGLVVSNPVNGFTQTPVRGGNLVIALPAANEPASLDAQVDPFSLTWLLDSFLTARLVILSPSGEYTPMIAKKWTLSPNGKILTLSLMEGLRFQDGTPLDAEAVKFNLDRVMRPETRSILMSNYLGVRSYEKTEVINKNTIKVYYTSPEPSVLWGLSIFPIWSPAAVQKYGREFQQRPLGVGPFRLTEWVRGSHMRFLRDANYRGGPPWQEHNGPAFLTSLTVRFVGEEAVLGEVLKTGEVNMVMELPAQFIPAYKSDSRFQIVSAPQPGTGMLFVMNTSRPPLDDIRVRTALRIAYDQDQMNQALYDGAFVPVKGPLTKFTRCYWEGAETAYRLDPERSKTLLDEAGWRVNTRTGIREKGGKALSLTVMLLHHKEVGEYLGLQFRKIGVDLKVELLPARVLLQRVTNADFDLSYNRLRSFEPDDLFAMWYSKNNKPGGWSWSQYEDPKLDALLLATQSTAQLKERCRLFIEAQKVITNAALSLPTVEYPIYYAMQKQVKGFKVGAFGSWFFISDIYVER